MQLNLHHARALGDRALAAFARRADGEGLRLLASGDFVGAARRGDRPQEGVDRVHGWLERAAALGSSYLRVASGFYRAELAGQPDVIEAERRYVVAVLQGALPAADDAGVMLLLENHSDFTADEYARIVDEVGEGRIGVFLDVINPVAAMEDPLPVIARLAPLARVGHVKDYALVSDRRRVPPSRLRGALPLPRRGRRRCGSCSARSSTASTESSCSVWKGSTTAPAWPTRSTACGRAYGCWQAWPASRTPA